MSLNITRHRQNLEISKSKTIYIYRVFFRYSATAAFLFEKMDKPVVSESIVQLSASMENLVVQSQQTAEINNTENGKFKI